MAEPLSIIALISSLLGTGGNEEAPPSGSLGGAPRNPSAGNRGGASGQGDTSFIRDLLKPKSLQAISGGIQIGQQLLGDQQEAPPPGQVFPAQGGGGEFNPTSQSIMEALRGQGLI